MEQTKQQRQGRAEADETLVEPVRQDTSEIDESTACCLADIDAALEDAGVETEEERALRDWAEWKGSERGRRMWQAQYAHLGLRINTSCCVAVLVKDGKVVA